MPLTVSTVESAQDIAQTMCGIVERYYLDVAKYQSLPILVFYRRVRAIPYCVELGEYQNLQRPGITLNGQGPFTACANKSIAIAAYLRVKGIPYRFKIVSDDVTESYHHVYPEACFDGVWVSMDATYPTNQFGISELWASEEEIYP